MQKFILTILLVFTFSYSVEFSNKLPMEMNQLVESFDCFSKRDKTAIYAYALALRYRFEHLKDKEALKRSDLDYWRLWHIVSDIEYSCKLSHDFDDILEEILFPTKTLKKQLKRLRWAESAIHTEGSSESSAKMSRYDKKLLDKIMKNPPKWSIEEKNKYLGDYNLTKIKSYAKNTIANKDNEKIIKESSENSKERKFLLRYAYLQEQYLHYYDKPKKRGQISKELSYLSNCFEHYRLAQHQTYYGNKKRKLVGKMLYGGTGKIFKKEMLPKEISKYCENNISNMKLDTFLVTKDKVSQEAVPKVRIPVFKMTGKLIDGYKKSGTDIKFYEEYITLSQRMLNGGGNDLVAGLRLLRLQSCLKTDNANQLNKLLKVSFEEMKEQDYKDEYFNRVVRPQIWWMTTIGMKIKQEGDSDKLKHFFDCNASVASFSNSLTTTNKSTSFRARNQKRNNDRSIMHKITSYKDKILKYYAATFVNIPTPNIDNKKAIEAGIIPTKWLEDNQTIKPISDVKLQISGMPKGGIKLTFDAVPKGEICERVSSLAFSDSIDFDRKTYEGLDYALIDENKIKVQHFNSKYVKRLCDKKDIHTISFVRENTIIERKYKPKPIDCSNDKYKNITIIDKQRYASYGFAVSGNHKSFVSSGSKSALYNTKSSIKMLHLPGQIDNANSLAINEEGKYLAVSQGNNFSFYDLRKKKMITRINYKHKQHKTFSMSNLLFLNDGLHILSIVENGQKVKIFNPVEKSVIESIMPKFISKEEKSHYRKSRITSISLSEDNQYLYIGGNRQKIEIWKIIHDNSYNLTYVRTIELPKSIKGREIAAITQDPLNAHNLYIAMKSDRLYLWSIGKNSVIKTYNADKFMTPKNIEISDDGKFIMVTGSTLYIWKINEETQWDMFSGYGLVGGFFVPDGHQIISIGKTIDKWDLMTSKSKRVSVPIIVKKKKSPEEKMAEKLWYCVENNMSLRFGRIKNFNANIKNDKGQTPLMIAVKNGNSSIIMSLMMSKAKVNVYEVDNEGKTVFDYNKENNLSSLYTELKMLEIEQLLGSKARVVMYDSSREPELVRIKISGESCEAFTFPKNIVCTSTSEDKKSNHGISKAIRSKNNTKKNGGKKVLKTSSYKNNNNKNKTIFDRMYEKYEKDVARGVPPTFAAIQNSLTKKLTEILDSGADIETKSKFGTALMFAVTREYYPAIKILLEHGANPNVMSGDELYSSLSQACKTHSIWIVKLLLEHKADVNYQHNKSETALSVAAKKCIDFELVKLLLDNGADPKLMDRFGKNTLTGLRKNCHDDVAYRKMKNLIESKRVK